MTEEIKSLILLSSKNLQNCVEMKKIIFEDMNLKKQLYFIIII